MIKQPIQPLYTDSFGRLRFHPNPIVEHLLSVAPIDLNDLARMPFEDNDREQFAQLIGYSLSGFEELWYAAPSTCQAAELMSKGMGEQDARIAALEATLANVKASLREALAFLNNSTISEEE